MQNPSQNFRVFAIDDDEDDQLIFARWVRRTPQAPTVTLLSSATEAITALKQLPPGSPELPHMILCDIKMPGLDGFDFLKWLRSSEHKQIPVVMRSSSPMHSDVAKAYELGANSYLVKRVDLHVMEERIETLIRYWRDAAAVPGREVPALQTR